jgi:thiol-disulfide isomerase/thioredoxin
MVKKNPDICVVLTKVAWCDHCKDFQEIFNNIESRIKHNETLKDKKIVLEKYDMQLDESKFAKKYNQFMKKIDGYPTVLLNIKDDKNKMKGEVIEHTVIEPNNKLKKEELINIATDKFISKIESSISDNVSETSGNSTNGDSNNSVVVATIQTTLNPEHDEIYQQLINVIKANHSNYSDDNYYLNYYLIYQHGKNNINKFKEIKDKIKNYEERFLRDALVNI